MTIRERTPIKELIAQSIRRIDGLAMWFVCLFFTLLTIGASIAKLGHLEFFMPLDKAIASFLFIPVTVVVYLYLAYFSTSSSFSKVVNAVILIGIPTTLLYKTVNL